jgi:hypothetical protein
LGHDKKNGLLLVKQAVFYDEKSDFLTLLAA